MNFVAQVEEHLRDLGTEARRKHPGTFLERGYVYNVHVYNMYLCCA